MDHAFTLSMPTSDLLNEALDTWTRHSHHLDNQMKTQLAISNPQINWCQFVRSLTHQMRSVDIIRLPLAACFKAPVNSNNLQTSNLHTKNGKLSPGCQRYGCKQARSCNLFFCGDLDNLKPGLISPLANAPSKQAPSDTIFRGPIATSWVLCRPSQLLLALKGKQNKKNLARAFFPL